MQVPSAGLNADASSNTDGALLWSHPRTGKAWLLMSTAKMHPGHTMGENTQLSGSLGKLGSFQYVPFTFTIWYSTCG